MQTSPHAHALAFRATHLFPLWRKMEAALEARGVLPLHPDTPLSTGKCLATSLVVAQALQDLGFPARSLWGRMRLPLGGEAARDPSATWMPHALTVIVDAHDAPVFALDFTCDQFLRAAPLLGTPDDVGLALVPRAAWCADRHAKTAVFESMGGKVSQFDARRTAYQAMAQDKSWYAGLRGALLPALEADGFVLAPYQAASHAMAMADA